MHAYQAHFSQRSPALARGCPRLSSVVQGLGYAMTIRDVLESTGFAFTDEFARFPVGMIRNPIFVLVGAFLVGCATPHPRPAPLTQADIISMVKAGTTDEDIMRRIDDTRTVFRLSSDDVIRLRNEGVSDHVVNFMLDTYTRAAVAEQRRYDADYQFRYGFYYGHPWHHGWW
jgi:hypothetical protein